MTWQDVPGWTSHTDLYDWAVEREVQSPLSTPSVMVEVGCWAGRSVIYLATKFKEAGLVGKVYAVDNWKGSDCDNLKETIRRIEFEGRPFYDLFMDNVRHCGVADTVTAIKEDSADAARYFDDGQVDFCFIDADHSEDAVARDIRAWLPKMRKGGLLAGHDYDRQSVYEGVKKVLGWVPSFGGPRIRADGDMTCWYFEVPR